MSNQPTLIAALDEISAAAYLNVSRSFLRQSRMNGHRIGQAPGPRYVRVGRMIRYRITDLDGWLNNHAVDPHPVPPAAGSAPPVVEDKPTPKRKGTPALKPKTKPALITSSV